MYKLNPEADPSGTGRIGTLVANPARLVATFGPPEKSDEYKVSGEYLFTDEQDRVFTIHDYKNTNLYDRDMPTPEAFWASDEPFEFSIGGGGGRQVSNPAALGIVFRDWVLSQLERE